MMHEPEKSDSVVVAEKPTNKAERSVAEPVEPRRPRGTRASKARAGRRTGQVCHRRLFTLCKILIEFYPPCVTSRARSRKGSVPARLAAVDPSDLEMQRQALFAGQSRIQVIADAADMLDRAHRVRRLSGPGFSPQIRMPQPRDSQCPHRAGVDQPRHCLRALRGLSDRQRQAKDRAAGLVRRCR